MTLTKEIAYSKRVPKLIKATFLAALFIFPLLLLTTNAFAQDAYEDIPEATFAQDSPFYFLRSWQEGVERFIANFQSDEAKTNLELRFAQRRLAEMRRLARLGKGGERMEKIRERWQEHLERAQEKADRMRERREEMRERILEQMDRHRTVLERVLEQVPEQAQGAINRAIENHTTNRERLLKNFSAEQRSQIEERLRERLDQTLDRFQMRRDRFRKILETPTE